MIQLPKELRQIRMPIFLEVEPFSNKYKQVLISQKKYNMLTAYMAANILESDPLHKCDEPECKGTMFECSDNIITLPDAPDYICK